MMAGESSIMRMRETAEWSVRGKKEMEKKGEEVEEVSGIKRFANWNSENRKKCRLSSPPRCKRPQILDYN